MAPVSGESPAKLNLTLRVCRRLPNGLHEIESLVTRIGLCDTVSVSPREDGRWTVDCSDPSIPRGDANLAVQAGRALAEHVGVRSGAHIDIEKRIPAGAGLGGGSSNAATTLTLLNDLWQCRLSQCELANVGATIGCDLPLFFHEPLCIVRGVGERIEEVVGRIDARVVLLLPPIHCDTREVYGAWDRTGGAAPARPIEEIVAAAERPAQLMERLFNDLERPALELYPELAETMRQARESASGPLRMTGSGSAFFRLFGDESAANEWAARVHESLRLRVEVVPLAVSSA